MKVKGETILKQGKRVILFLHSNSSFNIDDKVELILSPEFYWTRVFTLPVKNEKEALKVMPGLFEEFISIDNLSFYVKKLDSNRFLALAYDEKKVTEAVKKSGLKLQQVSACYFSQIEFEDVVKQYSRIQIDDVKLLLHDGIIMQVPSSLSFEEFKKIPLDSLSLSKEKIHLSNTFSFISQKNSYILSVIFLLFTVLNGVKIVEYYKTTDTLEHEIQIRKHENNLPATSIQTKAILQEYGATIQEQLMIRKTLSKIFNDTSKLKFKLSSLEYKNHTIVLQYGYENKDWEKILTFFKKHYKVIDQSHQNGILKMAVKYE